MQANAKFMDKIDGLFYKFIFFYLIILCIAVYLHFVEVFFSLSSFVFGAYNFVENV